MADALSCVEANFCTNQELRGVSVDLSSGGDCSTDPDSGIPDENCFFVPDPDNTVNRSGITNPHGTVLTPRF